MSLDIGEILKDWPYEPGQVSARRVRGADGGDKIQLRVDLGLLQMETTGRPDGQRPHGCESLLKHYEQELEKHKAAHGGEEGFRLDESACEMLRAEGAMYYHRYLAEFVLEDFDAVERDVVRNLRLMDFCRAYAEEQSDRLVLEQYRPYVIMMCARSRARKSLSKRRPKAALAAVKKGIKEIQQAYQQFGRQRAGKAAAEVAILRAMAKDIESRIPLDPVSKLKKDLTRAVEEERYEDAALLRDRLRNMSVRRPNGPGAGLAKS